MEDPKDLNDYFKLSEFGVNRLDEINDRLKIISEELKKYQPPISGRMTLELHNCKEGCVSCPHGRWKTWRWIKKRMGGNWFAAKDVSDPWRRIKASGEFKENYVYIKALVGEGQELLKEKDDYVKVFQKLRVAVKRTLKQEDLP